MVIYSQKLEHYTSSVRFFSVRYKAFNHLQHTITVSWFRELDLFSGFRFILLREVWPLLSICQSNRHSARCLSIHYSLGIVINKQNFYSWIFHWTAWNGLTTICWNILQIEIVRLRLMLLPLFCVFSDGDSGFSMSSLIKTPTKYFYKNTYLDEVSTE